MRPLTFVLLLCVIYYNLTSCKAIAQTATQSEVAPPGTGLWVGLYIKARLSKKLYYYSENHYRRRNSLSDNSDYIGRMGQVYNRFGLTVLFNKSFELTAGPVLVLNYTPDPGNNRYENMVLEPRFWHQWLFITPSMGRIKLYHQFRFEHRYKRTNVKDSHYDYTNRYRYKLYSYIPINKKELENKTFFICPSFEIFMHSGRSIVYNPMEDFRVYTAIGYIYNKFMFFGGHMWTLGQEPTGYQYKQNHIIRLNVLINFDLRKNKDIDPR